MEQLQLLQIPKETDELQNTSLPRIQSLSELDSVDEHGINRIIIQERNEDMRRIAKDMEHLSDISLSLKELVYEQGEDLEVAEENIEVVEENVEEATEHLTVAEKLTNKFRNIFAKGALVSTGVTGAGAATGIFLNPIAGGIGVIAGVGGLVYCIIQMTS